MIARILQHRSSKADIARLIAIDHNTWQLIRQAAYSPTDHNFCLADEGIARFWIMLLRYLSQLENRCQQSRNQDRPETGMNKKGPFMALFYVCMLNAVRIPCCGEAAFRPSAAGEVLQ